MEEGEEEYRQEEGWEVKSGVGRVKEKQPCGWRGDGVKGARLNLEPKMCVMIKDCETMRAGSVHVVMRHAIVEVRCVNVVIGVHIVVLFCPACSCTRRSNFPCCDTAIHLTRFSCHFFTYVFTVWFTAF